MPQTLEELQSEVELLKNLLQKFREKENGRLKTQYNKTKSLLGGALLKTKDLESGFENIQEQIELSTLMSELILANNPSTDKLGFNYQHVIFKQVEEVLLQGLPQGEETKDRFLSIVRKLFNNPLADLITQLNPVGSVVFRIIDAASNFFENKIIKRAGRRLVLSTKEVIAEEKIELFYKSVEKYINFYGKLADLTYRFDTQLENIKAKNTSLVLAMDNFHQRFLEQMGIDSGAEERGIIEQFNQLFELGPAEDGLIPFDRVLEKQEVISSLEFAQVLPEYAKQIKLLINEFTDALSLLIDQYIQTLAQAKEWEEGEIDKEALIKLIDWLEAYKTRNFTQDPRSREFGPEPRLVLRADNTTQFLISWLMGLLLPRQLLYCLESKHRLGNAKR